MGYDADEEIGARAEAATLKRMAELNRHVADVSDARVQAQRANGVRSYEQLRDRIEHTLPRLPAAADRQKNQTARRRTTTCRLARSVGEITAEVKQPPPMREKNSRATSTRDTSCITVSLAPPARRFGVVDRGGGG